MLNQSDFEEDVKSGIFKSGIFICISADNFTCVLSCAKTGQEHFSVYCKPDFLWLGRAYACSAYGVQYIL